MFRYEITIDNTKYQGLIDQPTYNAAIKQLVLCDDFVEQNISNISLSAIKDKTISNDVKEISCIEQKTYPIEESTLYNYTLTTANGTKYENTISGTSLFKMSEILKDTFPSAKEIEFKKDGETITTFYYD